MIMIVILGNFWPIFFSWFLTKLRTNYTKKNNVSENIDRVYWNILYLFCKYKKIGQTESINIEIFYFEKYYLYKKYIKFLCSRFYEVFLFSMGWTIKKRLFLIQLK